MYLRKLVALFPLLIGTAAMAGIQYGKTIFYDDVTALPPPAITNIQSTPVNAGGTVWTNGWVTNYYRVSATNFEGYVELSTNVTVELNGSVGASNAVVLSWPESLGAQSHILLFSTNGVDWTNWIALSRSTLSYTDKGETVWTESNFTNSYVLLDEPLVTFYDLSLGTVTADTYVGLPMSSTTVSGIVQKATDSDVTTGTDTNKYITPYHFATYGGAATDHGTLSGLGDDDHTIYLKVDGTRAMSGALNMGSQNITSVATITATTYSGLPTAGVATEGIVEKATDAEASTGTDTNRYVTPYHLATYAGGATDHGTLNGLGDDDHTQYLLIDGTRAMSGALNMGSQNITSVATITATTYTGLPTSSDTVQGIVEKATDAEVSAGTDTNRFVTPYHLATYGGETDHGALNGLGDDDHTIYLKVDGTRAMSGALNMGSQNITSVATISATTYSGLPTASETVQGIVERATDAEASAGTDNERFVTPLQLATYGGGAESDTLATVTARGATTSSQGITIDGEIAGFDTYIGKDEATDFALRTTDGSYNAYLSGNSGAVTATYPSGNLEASLCTGTYGLYVTDSANSWNLYAMDGSSVLYAENSTDSASLVDANGGATFYDGSYFTYISTPSYSLDCDGDVNVDGYLYAYYVDSTSGYGGLPVADETTQGIVERASDAEVATGTDTSRFITPAHLKGHTDDTYAQSVHGLNQDVSTSGTPSFSSVTATSALDIPSAANPTTDAEGEIALDSDDYMLEVFSSGTSRCLNTLQTAQMTVFDPDSIQPTSDALPVLAVEVEWAPHGITLVDVGIKTDSASSYSVTFEEWTDPATYSSEIETVATSSSVEAADDGTLTDSSIAAGSIVFIDLPATDIDVLQVWFTYYVNQGD
jgi:hypothetical protein